ncbi:MAG: dockerin type I repeat-containing protein [Ruminococcus sp.]|nr:dockerin type I repeat-containing protein [Ruminococcus sp.]
MKKLQKSAAFLSAVLIAVSSSAVTASAEDEITGTTPAGVTISFDTTQEGVEFGSQTDPELFKPVENATYISIPEGSLSREGYHFNGWTYDNVYAYQKGDVFLVPDDVLASGAAVTLEPVWSSSAKEAVRHTITYVTDFEGEPIERPEWLKDFKAVAGQVVSPDMTSIILDNAYSRGWFLGDLKIDYNQRIIMPDEDIVLTPQWFKRINFTFYAGDVDRLNGNTSHTFPKNEYSSTELAAADRFSRNGFNLTGWLSDYDEKIYAPGATVEVPSVDVTFTAVWTPKNYTVVFKSGVKGIDNVKLKGDTDTAVQCPDLDRDGYRIAGWKFEDKVYEVGEDFIIPGAAPGLGISLEAVWTEEIPESQEPAILKGDANLDGDVSISDAVAILQYLANAEVYPLDSVALINADVDGNSGVTGKDAAEIQLFDAGIITEFK